ncbi:MAG: cation:proton antiporter, partial [Verrucomicrobiota bacterium]|nr:cation:proton antiporter [Verrucomicrobiota bacterium]
VLMTLSLAMGGYALANYLHTSGPLAIVTAGLVVGNHGRAFAMSDETRENVDTFWELIDEVLNAILFVLIGLEVLTLPFPIVYLLAGLAAIPVVLLARFISVGATVGALRLGRMLGPQKILILTWGGLRGGISVALALSVPEQAHRDLFVTMTYAVVVFSILVQGLTMPRLLARAFGRVEARDKQTNQNEGAA